MKTKIALLVIALTACRIVIAQTYEWGRHFGSELSEEIHASSVDEAGNIYTVGFFLNTVDFDPGPGAYLLNSNGGQDIFIQKWNTKGELLWAKQVGGPGTDIPQCIAHDEQGNLYVSGQYQQTVDFDPGTGLSSLTATGYYDAFLLKLNAEGEFVWAKPFLGSNLSLGNDILIDQDQNIVLVGEFKGTMDADPGPEQYLISALDNWNGFILKLDAAGNFLWANPVGSSPLLALQGVALARDGGLITTGWFNGQADFDPGPETTILQSAGSDDVYIQKFDADGHFSWARRIGAAGSDISVDIATDQAGNIFIGGSFSHTVDFDPGPGTYPIVSAYVDAFILKLDQSGNFIWAKPCGGSNTDGLAELAIDQSGNVYATGYFVGNTDFDPGPGIFILQAPNLAAAYYWKLDFAGNLSWAKMSEGLSFGTSIAVNRSGIVYASGNLTGTIRLNPEAPDPAVTSAGNKDAYILRFNQAYDFSGVVFYDQNANGQQDGTEIGLVGIPLKAIDQERYALSNTLGEFHFYDNIQGDSVKPLISWPSWTVTPTAARVDSQQARLIFAANGPPLRDVCISVVERLPFRPGFPVELDIQVVNVGMVGVDAIPVRLLLLQILPDPLEILSVVPAPAQQNSEEIRWLIPQLEVYETVRFRVFLRTPTTAPLGTTVSISASAMIADDANPFNNGSRITALVVGSFDPNDKQVTPAKIAPESLDTTDLRYVIRFQNTGNYPADFVVIRDTLPEALDLSTLRILAASHAYTWRVSGPRVLEVRFDHINLPDSTSNEPESHGYVAFTVRAKDGLSLGDSIQNRAGIYFDYNAPVITNYAVMNVTNTVSSKAPVLPSFDFGLNPNPVGAHQPITLELDSADLKNFQVTIYDETGKKVRAHHLENIEKRLILAGLPSGNYSIQLRAGGRTSASVLLVK